MKYLGYFFLLPVFIFFLPCQSNGQITLDNAPALKKIDVEEHSGEKIPLDLQFINEAGDSVRLADYFITGRPVLLTLAYFRCPMLCGLVIQGLSKGITNLAFQPGKEFQMVTVSINPEEPYTLAAAKKKNILEALTKKFPADGWAFLTGEAKNSKKLADALGFKYYYIEERKEYAHPAVSFILTDEGIISRYLYGIEYKESDLRLALLEASKGGIGTTLDRIILYCYHYDPDAGGYVIFAGNLMRLGGVITVLILGSVLLVLWRKEVLFKSR
jgi:protein SCO1/2